MSGGDQPYGAEPEYDPQYYGPRAADPHFPPAADHAPAEPASEYGRLVRLFTLTGGRAQPSRDVFTLITLITAVQPAPSPEGRALQPEHLRILRLSAEPIAVVELAARLDLPVSVITVMLGDLLDAGMITARAPIRSAPGPRHASNVGLLKRVRDGLAQL